MKILPLIYASVLFLIFVSFSHPFDGHFVSPQEREKMKQEKEDRKDRRDAKIQNDPRASQKKKDAANHRRIKRGC